MNPLKKMTGWAREAWAVAVFAAAAFLLISLLSYDPGDLASRAGGGREIHNWGGVAGAFASYHLVRLFGLGAYCMVGALVIIAQAISRKREFDNFWPAVGGGAALFISLSSLAAIRFGMDPLPSWRADAGGIAGGFVGGALLHYFGRTGAHLILITVSIIAIMVSTHLRVRHVWKGSRSLALILTRAGFWLARRGARLARRASPFPLFRALWEYLLESEEDQHEDGEEPSRRSMTGLFAGLEGEKDAPTEEIRAEPIIIDTTPVPIEPKGVDATEEVRLVPKRARRGFKLPPYALLDQPTNQPSSRKYEDLTARAKMLEEKLRDFGADGRVVQVLPGPVVTLYEFEPASGVKVNRIVNLSDDLALVMKALSVRIIAPIPGKAAVGIEIPNPNREHVSLREIVSSDEFTNSPSKLTLALGKDILGRPAVTDLTQIPHLLVAGATGSGKSVSVNSMICSILFKATPDEVKLILIDPKRLEFSNYDGIPHLITPVVTDPKRAASVLRKVLEEMERRYDLLAMKGLRHIDSYNRAIERELPQAGAGAPGGDGEMEALPYIVVVIDELADLMMVSHRDVEDSIARLAQMARAAGIHLIVATQRPSVDVLTGLIKANFPARISFQVSSKVDSRTILDTNGAERLLGRGDMLSLPPGTSKLQRIHGAYVSEAEIGRLVDFLKEQQMPVYDEGLMGATLEGLPAEEEEYDEKYDEAVELVARTGQASISMIQRKLRVGYNRSARMIEIMEKEGLVGPADASKPRDVYINMDNLEEHKKRGGR